MTPKKIVLLTEGHGEEEAAPILVKRLLAERKADQELIFVDEQPLRVGSLPKVAKDNFKNFRNYLKIAAKRPKTAGVLVVLDGDCSLHPQTPFCAKEVGPKLAAIAQEEGGGQVFSVGVVFAMMEFESWLLAGSAGLAGQELKNRRSVFPKDFLVPTGDLENSPRDAKSVFSSALSGYRETTDQAAITQMVDIQAIRNRGMRSFRRLENAIDEILAAIRENRHISSPLAR